MSPNRPVSSEETMLELAEAQLSGSASSQQMLQLETLLLADIRLRQKYLQYLLLNGQLGLTDLALPKISLPREHELAFVSQAVPAFAPRSRHRFLLPAALTGLACVMGMLWAWRNPAEDVFSPAPVPGPVAEHLDDLPGPAVAAQETDSLHYDLRQWPVRAVGMLESERQALYPTTLQVETGATRLASTSGASVNIEGPALFGANSPDGGVLFSGSVHARLDHSEATFSVQTPNLRIVDLGTEFRVTTLDDQFVRVDVLDGEVEIQSRVRAPLFYWDFDRFESFERGAGVEQVAGIIGKQAASFNNSSAAQLLIREGTGPEVGTGDMACSSGISIEALFISHWSGEFKDYEEIFRKEDGHQRMLLSFQNDGNVGPYAMPEVAHGPCLAFGLHLEQQGYQELDMPLDGLQGRPTLAELTDGQPHHVVATYNSFTGQKAIYLDGQLRFSHTYPQGTLILSGGPTPAIIGNHIQREAFHGVLDEMALYDFALTPGEIAQHYQNFLNGQTYFGSEVHRSDDSRWHSITRLLQGESAVFEK